MASVLFGPLVTQVVGRVGGIAFQRTRSGTSVRAAPTPALGFKPPAYTSRGILSGLSHYFSWNLSVADVAAWNAYAAVNPVMNRLGQVSNLTGQQWFFKLNMNLMSSSYSMITTPPLTNAVGIMSTCTLTPNHAAGGSLSVTITAGAPTGWDVGIIKLSPPMSIGRTFISTQLRSMLITIPLSTPTNVISEWIFFFGTPPGGAGPKLIGKGHVLNSKTGIVSAELAATAFWT